jgi:hypothetical protein
MEMTHRTFIPREGPKKFSYFLVTSGVTTEDVEKYLATRGLTMSPRMTLMDAAYVNSLLAREFRDGARLEMDG